MERFIGRLCFLLMLILFWGVLPAGLLHGAGNSEPQGNLESEQAIVMEVISIHHRPAAELLPAIQSVLSPLGRASVDKVSNSLLIFDTAEKLGEIRKLIKVVDRPVPQVTVSIRYSRVQSSSPTLSTRGINAGQGRILSTGSVRQQEQMMLRVASGATGYLRTGKEVAFDEYWLELCGRYGYRFNWFSGYKRVETGFEVHPVAFGDRVDLTLYPKLSFDRDRTLVFTETATRTTVPLDTWVPVALTDSAAGAVIGVVGEDGNLPARGMIMEVKASVH